MNTYQISKSLKTSPVLIFFILSLFLIISCSSGGGNNDDDTASRSLQLVNPSSEAAFEEHLKKGLETQTGLYYRDLTVEDDSMESGNGADSPEAPYSETNLQEKGVDESDIIKSDGNYLYIAGQSSNLNMDNNTNQNIRIMHLLPDTNNSEEISHVTLNDSLPLSGLYLNKNINDEKDVLISVGSSGGNHPHLDWICPWSWQNFQTEINLINVTDPGSATIEKNFMFDGKLVSSRRIDNTLYLVLRFTAHLEGYTSNPDNQEEIDNNKQLLDETSLSDLLPKYTVDHTDTNTLVSVDNCYLPKIADESMSPDIITLVTIDIEKSSLLSTLTIAGPSESIYMSNESLYLATTQYSRHINTDMNYTNETTTDIHKLSLTEDGVTYKGSASVTGHLGWEQDKKSFRMGEKEGSLFVVTSMGATWDDTAKSKLTVLKEGETGELAEISHLPNDTFPEPIGKPGEKIYSTRFNGDRLYVVTFKVTDPLYIIDISDPEAPKISGSLEISGYSDYLHPVGENLVLGIGKDALPDTLNEGDGRGAWYQGLKVSLFNVIDPNDPQEINSFVIGKRGTDSGVLNDHHAIAFLPEDKELGRPARFAIPVTLHETPGNMENINNPWYHYSWTHTGLYLFEINNSQLLRKGEMVIKDSGTSEPDYTAIQDRALFVNESTYYVHDSKVWSAAFDNPELLNGPE